MLSFNDLHGNLEPPTGWSGRVTYLHEDGTTEKIDAGGVEYLATHLREARKGNRYSVTAAGGDMVGEYPLISGLFDDEPTIEALNKLDLDVTSVGNHEFDEGVGNWPGCRTAAATPPTAAPRTRSSRAPTSRTWRPTS
ncbi:Cell wall protein [Streptomyces hirsutus]